MGEFRLEGFWLCSSWVCFKCMFECLPMTRGIKAASLRSERFYSNKKHIRGIFRPWLRCDKLTESLWNLWSELKQPVQLFVWVCKITLKHSRVLHLCGFLPLKHYCIGIFSGRVQGVRGGRGHRRIHFLPARAGVNAWAWPVIPSRVLRHFVKCRYLKIFK